MFGELRDGWIMKPERSKSYRDFIGEQPCIACYPPWFRYRWDDRQKSPTEVAHVGLRGLGQKCSDLETLPLCTEHHRTGEKAHHVLGKNFWAEHGLDRDQLIASFQEKYKMEVAA